MLFYLHDALVVQLFFSFLFGQPLTTVLCGNWVEHPYIKNATTPVTHKPRTLISTLASVVLILFSSKTSLASCCKHGPIQTYHHTKRRRTFRTILCLIDMKPPFLHDTDCSMLYLESHSQHSGRRFSPQTYLIHV